MLDVESVSWIGASVALGLVALLHRVKRRRKVEIEIPPFLRDTADSSDAADSRFKGNWTEIHPLPRRIERDD